MLHFAHFIVYVPRTVFAHSFPPHGQVIEILHEGVAAISRAEVQDLLAKMYKVTDKSCIVIFGFHTVFGGGKTTGFGLIYDNISAMRRFEPKYRLVRVCFSFTVFCAGHFTHRTLPTGWLVQEVSDHLQAAQGEKEPWYVLCFSFSVSCFFTARCSRVCSAYLFFVADKRVHGTGKRNAKKAAKKQE